NYLTEPLIKTNGFQLTPNPAMQPYPCYPTVEVPREKGEVPHHLPGENPFLEEFAKKHHLPQNGVRGGAETALPEFIAAGANGPAGKPDAPVRKPAPNVDSEIRSGH